jgi:hypothetical protein
MIDYFHFTTDAILRLFFALPISPPIIFATPLIIFTPFLSRRRHTIITLSPPTRHCRRRHYFIFFAFIIFAFRFAIIFADASHYRHYFLRIAYFSPHFRRLAALLTLSPPTAALQRTPASR